MKKTRRQKVQANLQSIMIIWAKIQENEVFLSPSTPEVKCSILGIISIMTQRRPPKVATVKSRSLATSLNIKRWVGFLVFNTEIAFRIGVSIHFTSRDTFKCFYCGVLSRLTLIFLGVDKIWNMEHSGTFRNIPEHPRTSLNMKKLKYFFMKK